MKNIFKYIIHRLPLLFVLVGLIFMTSCEDDENPNAGEVTLLSFGPSGVSHGEEIIFVGRNLDKVNSVVLKPDITIERSEFVEASSGSFKIVVPQGAEAGKIILNTPQGEIESKTHLNFNVEVVIASITQEAKPGTNITITGSKLNWIENVTFASDLVVEQDDFVSRTQTELVITVPMEAQTGQLIFSTGGTEPLTFTSEEDLIVTMPAITDVSPLSLKHTDDLTIEGTNLDLVSMVTFPDGTQVTEFVDHTASKIVVTVPSTTVNGKIILTVPSGLTVESASGITIILPNVTSISPDDTGDHQPGVELVMEGENLELVGQIVFPGVSTAVTSFVSQTSTQLRVIIPDGVQGGTVALKTIHGYTVPVALPFGDQLELGLVIYDDAARNGYGAWGGWGGASFDITSTENPRVGTSSIKAIYAGDWGGAAQFGGGSSSTAGFAYFAFSIYGGAGTDGKNIQLNLKSSSGEGSVQVSIVEGEWTDHQIPLSDLGNPSNITEVAFQDTEFSGVVYIDHIGLR